MMDKLARTRSKDPIQERLKENKAQWNEKTSKFISLLIALKQGLNGKPVPALNIPAGRLHEPMPDSVIQLIGQMAGVYEELTQTAKQIVQQQQEHAEEVGQRRQQKQISTVASDIEAQIIKEADNVFSNIWGYLNDEDRKLRKNFWRQLAVLQQDELKNIRYNLASRDIESIPKAVYLTKDFMHNLLYSVVSPMGRWYNKMGHASKLIEDQSEGQQGITPELGVDDIAQMKQNVHKMLRHHTYLQTLTNGIQQEDMRDYFQTLLGEFSIIQPKWLTSYEKGDFDRAQELYSMMVQKINLADQTIQRYREEVEAPSLVEKDDTPVVAKEKVRIEKLAQSRFKTWFLRKWLSLWTTRDSNLRQGALAMTDNMDAAMKNIMGIVLDKDVDFDRLAQELQKLVKFTKAFSTILSDLIDIHNNYIRMNRGEKKGQLIPDSDKRILRKLRIRLENGLEVKDSVV